MVVIVLVGTIYILQHLYLSLPNRTHALAPVCFIFYFYVFSSFNILNAFPPIIFKIILDYIAKILVNLFIVNFQKLIFPKIILLLLFSNF